jgi:hypothetical protein
MKYYEFLQSKMISDMPSGIFDDIKINDTLFDYQKDIVNWAIKRGRAAIFADCGLGKTFMQIEWCQIISERTGRNVLILAPLAVCVQTRNEARRIDVEITLCRKGDDVKPGINITNYEMLDHFDCSQFVAICLDESSILKSFTGKTCQNIIEIFSKTPFRLACTATPSPNDYMELGTHSEFLGVMSRTEMLATFFVHDMCDTAKWRIKGHAKDKFWSWVSSWASILRSPADLGYSDEMFILPKLHIHTHIVESVNNSENLFAIEASTLDERRDARKSSINDHVKKAASIINNHDQYLIWCDYNAEGDLAESMIDESVQVAGSDTPEYKEQSMIGFSENKNRILISKSSICGWGMNWQNCHEVIFIGLSDSYESFYQAVRRCWRFGQKHDVNVHIIISQAETAVLRNIRRKESQGRIMSDGMIKFTAENVKGNIKSMKKDVMEYKTEIYESDNFKMMRGDCVDLITGIASDSIHYSVYSSPFASLYTYSNSERDMGNCRTHSEFYNHFRFLAKELCRVLIPGRLMSFHCMNLPTSKERDGFIGITDFRGELIRIFIDAGFIFHSEVCIWKDPVTAMQRTKALGLLHTQIKKDSCMSRQGIPDYLVTMRKKGDNPERVSHTPDTFPVSLWQQYASPVWMDINPSETLQKESARENDDERHICPLQLQVIQRALELWTNPGDTVLSPFGGIGSEGYQSIKMGRKYIGFELKESYYRCAVKNLIRIENEKKESKLF